MNTIDLLPRLWTASLALSLALAIVAALRIRWRRWFGAEHACRLWWLPPLALLASQLPHAATATQAVIVRTPVILTAATPMPSAPAAATMGVDWRAALIVIWLAGACALLVLGIVRQWRFLRALRDARHVSLMAPAGITEILRAGDAATGPALVGVWRLRLVLPCDFEQRYDTHERALIVAHEIMHARRRDGLIGAVATVLHALFWFHPFAWWALPRLRRDQELACDAAVVRERPLARRCYAQAMLKAQFAGAALPAGSFWPSHPIRERIVMLKLPVPDSRRRLIGRVAVGGLAIAISVAAYAAGQPPTTAIAKPDAHAPEYQLAMRILRDGHAIASPIVCMKAGETASVSQSESHDGQAWNLYLSLRAQSAARGEVRVALDGSLREGGDTGRLHVALRGPVGKPMSVRMDGAPRAELEIVPTPGCNARRAPPPPPPPHAPLPPPPPPLHAPSPPPPPPPHAPPPPPPPPQHLAALALRPLPAMPPLPTMPAAVPVPAVNPAPAAPAAPSAMSAASVNPVPAARPASSAGSSDDQR